MNTEHFGLAREVVLDLHRHQTPLELNDLHWLTMEGVRTFSSHLAIHPLTVAVGWSEGYAGSPQYSDCNGISALAKFLGIHFNLALCLENGPDEIWTFYRTKPSAKDIADALDWLSSNLIGSAQDDRFFLPELTHWAFYR